MKLVTFSVKQYHPLTHRIGLINSKGNVTDAAAAYRSWLLSEKKCEESTARKLTDALLPGDMTLFLQGGDISMDALKQAASYAESLGVQVAAGEKLWYQTDEITLHAPLFRPSSIRDFLSFEEHLKNSLGRVPPVWYEIPIYYKGIPASVIGPDEECIWPDYSEIMDYELEFACVIGKRGKDIPASEAHKYIAGYMIFNDFSARDKQFAEMEGKLGPAKGKDFCTAIGPYLVTPDEIPDVYNMPMRARVNGELWSEGNSNTMYRTFAEIIEYASTFETLLPGDILGSGTVGNGCGLELKKYLKEGDVIELEIEPLGVLRNRIVRKR